jgi:ATP-dependent DNA helicase RecG
MDLLHTILDRIQRPIRLAADHPEMIQRVQDLPGYVLGQIRVAMEAASRAGLHDEMRRLEGMFTDYERLTPSRRLQRLRSAESLLAQLQSLTKKPETAPETPTPADAFPWELPIHRVRGVGPKRAERFRKLGMGTIEDLLYDLPWRYEDRSRLVTISELTPNQNVTVRVQIQSATVIVTPRRRMRIFQALIGDETGSLIVKWFNQPYLKNILKPGRRLMLSGSLQIRSGRGVRLEMENPVYELIEEGDEETIHTGRVVGIYHETQGLTSRYRRELMRSVIEKFVGGVPDRLPEPTRARLSYPPLADALRSVHFPEAGEDLESLNRWRTPAHRRLVFEECLEWQIGMALQRRSHQRQPGGVLRSDSPRLERFLNSLPFELTGAQRRVLDRLRGDLGRPYSMNRLLQGDVGSGKTVVAVAAMILSADSGYQSALMAPTEVLAEQHFLTLRPWLDPLGLETVLVNRGIRANSSVFNRIREGKALVAVGTHALLEEKVRFKKLGLVVIDEQHKFGVRQRASLLDKPVTGGKTLRPHLLIMTATPIPRTLALTLYGDLEVSTMEELPKGRRPIGTRLYRESQRSEAYRLLSREVELGRQAYVVYPLVEESEKTDLKAAVHGAHRLRNDIFPHLRIGLLHGRMKPAEKEAVMADFKRGGIQVLVATTVIEVGVDVPNASVMLIEHAERFGLSQLHQLRGRVGRGPHPSHCLLLTGGAVSDDAYRRLQVLVRTQDGFAIAEEDLAIRGPGEFFGTRQSGLPELKRVDLISDAGLMQTAREEARHLLEQDPFLTSPAHRELRAAVLRRWTGRIHLGSVG